MREDVYTVVYPTYTTAVVYRGKGRKRVVIARLSKRGPKALATRAQAAIDQDRAEREPGAT